MRFNQNQDYQTILKINKELINNIVDTPVIIYKLVLEKTKTNIYGEGTKKVYYRGVIVPCIIDRKLASAKNDVGTIDFEQAITFAFLKKELEDRNMYPESGDIIEFDSQYFEIENTNQVQLWAGQVAYDHQVFCESHLMRKAPIQLERPIV